MTLDHPQISIHAAIRRRRNEQGLTQDEPAAIAGRARITTGPEHEGNDGRHEFRKLVRAMERQDEHEDKVLRRQQRRRLDPDQKKHRANTPRRK